MDAAFWSKPLVAAAIGPTAELFYGAEYAHPPRVKRLDRGGGCDGIVVL